MSCDAAPHPSDTDPQHRVALSKDPACEEGLSEAQARSIGERPVANKHANDPPPIVLSRGQAPAGTWRRNTCESQTEPACDPRQRPPSHTEFSEQAEERQEGEVHPPTWSKRDGSAGESEHPDSMDGKRYGAAYQPLRCGIEKG